MSEDETKRTSPQERATATTKAARAIVDAEASARGAKTARLKEARLKQETEAASEVGGAVKSRPKAKR
jgi:hypothetical protein